MHFTDRHTHIYTHRSTHTHKPAHASTHTHTHLSRSRSVRQTIALHLHILISLTLPQLHVTAAMGMDHGGSTTMYVRGHGTQGIVSCSNTKSPSDPPRRVFDGLFVQAVV